jgi:hypothetical protein
MASSEFEAYKYMFRHATAKAKMAMLKELRRVILSSPETTRTVRKRLMLGPPKSHGLARRIQVARARTMRRKLRKIQTAAPAPRNISNIFKRLNI